MVWLNFGLNVWDLFFWQKWKRLFLWATTAAEAAEIHGNAWDLSCYSRLRIHASITIWINSQWSNGQVVRVLHYQPRGSGFKTTRWFPMSAQPFILPRSIKWVPGTPGDLKFASATFLLGKTFFISLQCSFRSWDYQILNFQTFKCYDVIKCLSIKHETHFTE